MPLLDVNDLRVEVEVADLGWAEAVSGVSLSVERAEALGIVGESGCGKSLTVLSILGLLPDSKVAQTGGAIDFDGASLSPSHPESFRAVRGSGLGFVPQNPMSALNPVLTVGDQVAEAVRLHQSLSRRDAMGETVALMRRVGLPSPEERRRAYPHQLSGGQRQRVLIAMALAGDPELLIADEPTTALDVTVQAQILQLLGRLRRDRAMSLLLVTHNLGVVAQTCDRIMVLYAGQVVESGPARDVLGSPAHPYTRALHASIPRRRTSGGGARLDAIPGSVPGVGRWPEGCRFRDRCPRAEARCAREEPVLTEVAPGRLASCHFAEIRP
ncbi:MAG: peptide/nickel transport system ATP-binding protein [Myxococcota bacterium]